MKAAGVVAIGKTNTPEFGAGSHTFNEVYGVTRNPWRLERTAGGSSGGATVALACRWSPRLTGVTPAARCATRRRGTRGRVPPDGAGRAVRRPGQRLDADRAQARWGAPSTTSPSCSAYSVRLMTAIRCIGRSCSHPSCARPSGGYGWPGSRDLGVPVERTQLDVLADTREVMVDLGWDVVDRADLARRATASGSYGRGTSPPVARRASTTASINSSRRSRTRSGAARGERHGRRNGLRPVGGAVAGDGGVLRPWLRPAGLPVTQVSPFPVEVEYPTEVAGVALSNDIDWMAACWRITVTGCPTLSLPAGFDVEGIPVGVQLVTRQGADVALLRAAKVLEEATGFAARDRRSWTPNVTTRTPNSLDDGGTFRVCERCNHEKRPPRGPPAHWGAVPGSHAHIGYPFDSSDHNILNPTRPNRTVQAQHSAATSANQIRPASQIESSCGMTPFFAKRLMDLPPSDMVTEPAADCKVACQTPGGDYEHRCPLSTLESDEAAVRLRSLWARTVRRLASSGGDPRRLW